MWALVVVLILVCGHHYVDAHLPSKYKLKKSVGWNAYFIVVVKGFEFLVIGAILALAVITVLYIVMWFMNIPAYLWNFYAPFTYMNDLMKLRLAGFSAWSVLWLTLTVLTSLASRLNHRKFYQDHDNRMMGFREIAKDNAVENLIIESLDHVANGILLFVTLKSRKVYVGMVDGARFQGLDTNTLVIIPFLSGYRAEDTLTFHIEHNYASHYENVGITEESSPLSYNQFRHVIPMDAIESFSLFNIDTYFSFLDHSVSHLNKKKTL